MKSYTLQQIQQMLEEPSFYGIYENKVKDVMETIEQAVEHHEKLDKANNGEGF